MLGYEEVNDMECRERLERYLRENGVSFEVMEHRQAFTMPEVAAALHVPGRQVAKVVMVKADGRMVMLVVPSPDRLDFAKLRDLLAADEVRLATEEEFSELFPDCAIGAMPSSPNLKPHPQKDDGARNPMVRVVSQTPYKGPMLHARSQRLLAR